MKEYEAVYAISDSYNRYSKALDAIVSAINNRHYDMLNLEAVKRKLDEVFDAMVLKSRFDELYKKSNGKLVCNKTDFDFESHKFETLDEVEKAIKNKAFL